MQLSKLRANNRAAISRAGPRYAPGIDPDAPNLEISSLTEALDGIGLSTGFRAKVRDIRKALEAGWKDAPRIMTRRFERLAHNPVRLTSALENLERASPRRSKTAAMRVQRTSKRVADVAKRLMAEIANARQAAPSDGELRRRLDHQYSEASRFIQIANRVSGFVRSPAFALTDKNGLLLLGEWGTGKTHALCDLTERRMRDGSPTLLCLGQQLPPGTNPIEGICQATGLARNPRRLLASLQRMGARRRERALLIVDAINEGDRLAWRRALPALCRELARYPNVGLVLSCRQPFDQQIIGKRMTRRLVPVYHRGFSEIEFDAQLSFFQYYDIPAPHFPLITPEFSRPLFLQLLCKAIAQLSPAGKHRQLRDFASGQRGMTYLLEYFVKQAGARIEDELGVPRGTCWRILKGHSAGASASVVGIGPTMAAELRDYVTRRECLAVIRQFVPGPQAHNLARQLLGRMLANGLLAEDVRWEQDRYAEIVRFAYQRFGDHVVARHLLAQHLKTTSVHAVRCSFYRNRPLGRVFELSASKTSFQWSGFASAIMLEFPERVRGHVPQAERELIFYLPRTRRLLAPFKDVFLEGLSWRSSDSFTAQTDHLVSTLLEKYGDRVRNETLEVLVGLATRPGHPYSVTRLRAYLQRMRMADRDLTWSEYIRAASDVSVIARLLEWVERNIGRGLATNTVPVSITLLSLLLTTTQRALRDRVTRALFLLGLRYPDTLFSVTLDSLAFNDPYVPERVLAAAYGVAISLWADPVGGDMRSALVPFARRLLQQMFLPNAATPTAHALTRDYALSIISLARRVVPGAIPRSQLRFLRPPFAHLPSPLPAAAALADEERAETEPALYMDFNNYTLGGLVRNRQNYDFNHAEYQEVRKQLLGRMFQLGYSYTRFKTIDDYIGRGAWSGRSADGEKTDRYGKKYAWIAYFELYGTREATGLLVPWREGNRTSDCDIDPSFPDKALSWLPTLRDPFRRSPKALVQWLQRGPRPRYEHLLERQTIQRLRGPWVLLDGFIEQGAKGDPRVVFTFLRGLLVKDRWVDRLRRTLDQTPYPGNHAIPEPYQDYYTFAGEVPWSVRYGSGLRTRRGKGRRNTQLALGRSGPQQSRGIPVEVPVHEFSWESYHSTMNRAGGARFPAPALCETLGLVNHARRFDLYDRSGRQATVLRSFRTNEERGPKSWLLYIRRSLLRRYLRHTGQRLVWVLWGERNLHGASGLHQRPDIAAAWQGREYIHKKSVVLP